MIPVYCINAFPERKAKIAAELDRAGFTDVTYVHAAEPMAGFQMNNMRRNPRGEFGCALSHIKTIALAISDDKPDALFIEDDIEFVNPDAATRFLRENRYASMVYLGGHPREKVEATDQSGVYKVGKWSCAEAYYLNRYSMEAFLQFWCDNAGQPKAMFDFILGEFAATLGDAYALYPPATRQPPGWSHIGQKHDDKRDLIERGWKSNLPT